MTAVLYTVQLRVYRQFGCSYLRSIKCRSHIPAKEASKLLWVNSCRQNRNSQNFILLIIFKHFLLKSDSSLIARRWVGHETLCWFRLKDLSIDGMVGAGCFGCCQTHRGLPVGFLLLRFSVFLSPYLCFISFLYLD